MVHKRALIPDVQMGRKVPDLTKHVVLPRQFFLYVWHL